MATQEEKELVATLIGTAIVFIAEVLAITYGNHAKQVVGAVWYAAGMMAGLIAIWTYVPDQSNTKHWTGVFASFLLGPIGLLLMPWRILGHYKMKKVAR